MVNQRNFGIVEGRLVRDPKIFTNADGSKNIKITLAARRNFKNKSTGMNDPDYVSLEAFVSADTKGAGPYDYMHKGDLIGAEYTVRSNAYTDKDTGEEVYNQVLFIQSVDYKESKTVTQNRQNNTAAPQPASAPAATADETPFAD